MDMISSRILLLLCTFTFFISGADAGAPRKKILVLISSATSIPLTSPSTQPQVPVGFYLVELGLMLREYEGHADFVFATPDGKAPTIDVNGLDLNSQIQGWTAPWHALASNFRDVQIGPNPGIRKKLKIEETVESIRSSKPKQMAWREADIQAAIRHLGGLAISAPLANSSVEAVAYGKEISPKLEKIPPARFLSFQEVLAKDSNVGDSETKLKDFDFVYIPGGHAPMVDFRDNPYLGEILNRSHDLGKLIIAVCHGPIALQSSQYRIKPDGTPLKQPDFTLKGTKVTTVSAFEEKIMMSAGYFHVPSHEATQLPYLVDQALIEAGFKMEYGSPMVLGVQARPGFPHIVYDEKKNVLTSNGPQSVKLAVDKLKELQPPQ